MGKSRHKKKLSKARALRNLLNPRPKKIRKPKKIQSWEFNSPPVYVEEEII